MKIERYSLFFLLTFLTGLLHFQLYAQQKNGIHHASFSGKWISKESISMGGNIVCSYDAGDCIDPLIFGQNGVKI